MTQSIMTIEDGTVVALAYHLKSKEGKTLDQATAEDPFHYLHGEGHIVAGLEDALVGLKKGDKKLVTVLPEDGYGMPVADLKMTVSRKQFPEGAELQVGMQFETETQDGDSLIFTVEKIEEDQVSIDGNHPLAGETLVFDVEVLDVRKATEEEMSHGHAHGADGHHHH